MARPSNVPHSTMIIDAVDENNDPVGKVRRADVFRGRNGFRTVHVFVFNASGELLIQQLSRHQTRHPLAWGSSVAGYLFSGESYAEAATRRVKQELGLESVELTEVGVCRVEDLGHAKFVGLFCLTANGPFLMDRSHIEQIQFVSIEGIQRHIRRSDIAFTKTFLALFRYYRTWREQSGPE